MSLLSQFTELEIASGVPWLSFYGGDESDLGLEEEEEEAEDLDVEELFLREIRAQEEYDKLQEENYARKVEESRMKIRLNTKFIALKTNLDIKTEAFRQVLKAGAPLAKRRYRKIEKIEKEDVCLAEWDGCLDALFGKMLKMASIEDADTTSMEKSIRRIRKMQSKTAYERTSEFRSAVFSFIEKETGGSANRIFASPESKDLIRSVLATARLHFNILDIKSPTLGQLAYIVEISELRYQMLIAERERGGKSYPGFVPGWNAYHVRSLINYYSPEARDAFRVISSLDVSYALGYYRERVVEILASLILRLPYPRDEAEWSK